jgi:hypothetical protein
VLEIKFITWDEATDGVAVEHDGCEVWSENSPYSWDQYFRHHMPKGTPVLLSQDTRPSERKPDDRDYPRGEGTDARLKRWLVDYGPENGADWRVREVDCDEDDAPLTVPEEVTMVGDELYALLLAVADRMYWHGADDVCERYGIRR